MGTNSEREIIGRLITTIIEMCGNPAGYQYDKDILLQRVKMNCGDDERLYSAIEQGIEDDISESRLIHSINAIKKSIHTHFREQKLDELLNKAHYTFRYKRQNIKDTKQFFSDLIAGIEPLLETTNAKDPALIGEIDFSNKEEVHNVFVDVVDQNNGDTAFITGNQDLNTMMQGGMRRGETIVPLALQHGYKTGFSLGVFHDCAVYNVPKLLDPNRKPLLLRISFEDPLSNNLQFLYQKSKYDETNETVDIKSVGIDEMTDYVMRRMTATGFNIKMLFADPTQWTYMNVINKVLEYEAQGYEVQLCMLDYLYKLPTTGCNQSGPIGTDVRDMLRRLRNFFKARKTTFFTPHQLSTEAKRLSRIHSPMETFVKEIADKGYYAGSAQLDQEIDLELYLHIVKHNGEHYLTIQRGKHRLPTVIPESDKYTIFKFPKKMPIPTDINGVNRGMKKLPRHDGDGSDSLFTF